METEEASARAALGDPQAVARLAALGTEREGMLAAALAHDQCARQALAATSAISEVLALSHERNVEGKTPDRRRRAMQA